VQVEQKAINAVSKEITITVPAEQVSKAYDKYLRKASKSIAIPGFRPGKAPLAMVERQHADTIMDYFYKDYVDEVFDEAAREHDIRYLLFPEVKDITWEKGQDMTLKIEVEHEPTIEFKQLDGLEIPHHPQSLDEEIDKYLANLKQENGRMIDVETAEADDAVDLEISFKHGNESYTKTGTMYAGTGAGFRSLEGLVGCKTGDTLELAIRGKALKLVTKDAGMPLENDFEYPCQVMVNSVMRIQYPELDDEFAKDMDFENMEQMRAKLAEDMKLHNEHLNINIDNYSVIQKLYIDNRFDLPHKTIEYLAEQETEKVPNPEYRKYYAYQYKMQIAQEMISMYVMHNLKKAMPIELTDEMLEEYITHEAILEDKSVEAYKTANAEDMKDGQFREAAENYFILRKIATGSSFFIPEPEKEEAIPEAEITETLNEESQTEGE